MLNPSPCDQLWKDPTPKRQVLPKGTDVSSGLFSFSIGLGIHPTDKVMTSLRGLEGVSVRNPRAHLRGPVEALSSSSSMVLGEQSPFSGWSDPS